MHILIERGTVKSGISVYMHHSWEYLKYQLTGGMEYTIIDSRQWDAHDAWEDIRLGHIICDGPAMWAYINGFEFGGEDDLIQSDPFDPQPGKEIRFLMEMNDMEQIEHFVRMKEKPRLTYEEWKELGFDRKAEVEADDRFFDQLEKEGILDGE